MDEVAEHIVRWLISQGWPGVVIILLLADNWWTRNQNRVLRAQIDSIQEKRVSDNREYGDKGWAALEATRGAIASLREVMQARRSR